MSRPSDRLAEGRRLAMRATSGARAEATAIDVQELAEAEVAELSAFFTASGWSTEVVDGELRAARLERPPAPEHWIAATLRRCSTLEEAAASTGLPPADLEAWLARNDLAAAELLRPA